MNSSSGTWTMVQVPDEEFINGIAATFDTDPIARPEVRNSSVMLEAEHYRPVMLEVNGLLLSPFGAEQVAPLTAQTNAVLALVPAQACKTLGFLPKKALWSTCGRLGWPKAGLWSLHRLMVTRTRRSRKWVDVYAADKRARDMNITFT
ncbi:hypothetical protein NCS52_00613200 [Fusarium sp. LHS14.1]|nr:hypothetical protein NCS52_00613200 [Fusarium sp. LHS14.1]